MLGNVVYVSLNVTYSEVAVTSGSFSKPQVYLTESTEVPGSHGYKSQKAHLSQVFRAKRVQPQRVLFFSVYEAKRWQEWPRSRKRWTAAARAQTAGGSAWGGLSRAHAAGPGAHRAPLPPRGCASVCGQCPGPSVTATHGEASPHGPTTRLSCARFIIIPDWEWLASNGVLMKTKISYNVFANCKFIYFYENGGTTWAKD